MKAYNTKASVRSHKINGDEMQAVKFLAEQDETFVRRLKSIWGTEKLQHTSMPLSLLCSNFLSDASELPIAQKANPVWHQILTPTAAKRQQWLNRVDGRFQEKATGEGHLPFSIGLLPVSWTLS
jgi:hypothetical protein